MRWRRRLGAPLTLRGFRRLASQGWIGAVDWDLMALLLMAAGPQISVVHALQGG